MGDSMWVTNQSPASRETWSSAPGSSNRCVGPVDHLQVALTAQRTENLLVEFEDDVVAATDDEQRRRRHVGQRTSRQVRPSASGDDGSHLLAHLRRGVERGGRARARSEVTEGKPCRRGFPREPAGDAHQALGQ